VPTERYSEGLDDDLAGLRVGLLAEGFGWEGLSEPEVDEAVREAGRRLEKGGAAVREVSVPMHRAAMVVWLSIALEGAADLLVHGNGFGTNRKGWYGTGLLDAFGRGRRARADDLADTVKLLLMAGEHVRRNSGGHYYSLAQNQSPRLRAAYDGALDEVDVLVLPTQPLRATPLPGPDASREELVGRAIEMVGNTAPFNVTGHPAVSVPCQPPGSMPIGLMVVGRHFADRTALRVAAAVEELFRGGG
jgi:amidase